MAGQQSGRPLMPQYAQEPEFAYVPPAPAPKENQKNYVFVDEHNRHKRLKVMRACEGCRKRKIKCDAATTNTWPCGACVRLRLHCVPPTISYDNTDTSPISSSRRDVEHSDEAESSVMAQQSARRQQSPTDAQRSRNEKMLPSSDNSQPEARRENSAQDIQQQSVFHQLRTAGIEARSRVAASTATIDYRVGPSDDEWTPDAAASSLTQALGDLNIDHTAVAAYITNQKKSLLEAPAQEEEEFELPSFSSPDHTVRIPLEMMPSEQQALDYFDYFFNHIHPYVPVVHRACFEHQWRTNRDLISPILLEAVFACASVMLDGPSESNKWLALAAKHGESFKDVPRLSTLQAMILSLKARESSPQRGYYYRSWVTVINCIAMAKDLDLHEHYELHKEGRSCGSSMFDCATKTKIWHTLFILGVMVGGPQGRSDFGINIDTLDLTVVPCVSGSEPSDIRVSRHFTYFLRAVKSVQETHLLYIRLKKTGIDWAQNAEFTAHNAVFEPWLQDLPPDLQIHYPPDNSPPYIINHVAANFHCYHHLSVIMHYRPQLSAASRAKDGSWRPYLVAGYDSAKKMCRLQEAILRSCGLPGLLCMQRGINFTIYTVLTCTMLHLIALTSPDPQLYSDGRDFFTRHMRILEQCISAWPLTDLQTKVDTLRQAFSADVTKPFELKLSFIGGSPEIPNRSNPPVTTGYGRHGLSQHSSFEQSGQIHVVPAPITPPSSATDYDCFDFNADNPIVPSSTMMVAGARQQQGAPTSNPLVAESYAQFDPTRILDHWNAAFGTPAASVSSQSSPPMPSHTSPTIYEIPQTQAVGQYAYPQSTSYPHPAYQFPTQTSQTQPLPVQQYVVPEASYITPSMWQDAVASSFADGGKRRRQYIDDDDDRMSKRFR